MRSVEEAIAYVIVKERKFVPTSTEDDVLKFTSVSVLLDLFAYYHLFSSEEAYVQN